jgi:hypothetical protein
MQPAKINFSTYFEGCTWEGFSSATTVTPETALASVKMTFLHETKDYTFTYSSTPTASQGTITINDTVTWDFIVEAMVLPLPLGLYDFDLIATDTTGRIIPVYYGKFKISKNVANGT